MTAGAFNENLESDPIMQILTGVDFIANIGTEIFCKVKNGSPTLCQLIKSHLNQTRCALRPRMDIRPRQGAGKTRIRANVHFTRSAERVHDLIQPPFLTRLGLPCIKHCEPVKRIDIGGKSGDKLTLQVGRKLGHFDAILGCFSAKLSQ